MDASKIRDEEATCKTCTWWKCETRCAHGPVIVFKGENDYCSFHPLNKLAEQRWMDEEMQEHVGPLNPSCLKLHGIGEEDWNPAQHWEGVAHKQIDKVAALAKECDKLRAQLEITQDARDIHHFELKTVTKQLATCAAGPWEDYDEAKHKDERWRLTKFSTGCTSIIYVAAWIGNEWHTLGFGKNFSHSKGYLPTRVAELRE